MVKFFLIALFLFPLAACQQEAEVERQKLSIITADGREVEFQVEIALSDKERAQGLMHRTEMADDAGMLFYFTPEQELRFWMKNTLIPLDMIFIKADGTIHHIHENAIPHDLTGVTSNGKVAAVLEINGGFSQKLRLSIGDVVKHHFFDGSGAE